MAVRRYRLDVSIDGLVHIGNGQKYGKKDYFATKDKKIAVLDVRKFVSNLDAQQVKEYCSFLEDGRPRGDDLQSFLRKNPAIAVKAQQAVAYEIDSPLATARRGSIQYHDVWEFVKDPYGCPYIPGSSVKGMIRTALLTNILLGDSQFRHLFDRSDAYKGSRAKGVDKTILRRAFWKERPDENDDSVVNDVMKYVSVSDSAPLAKEDLVFAKKYDHFSKADRAEHKLQMGKLTLQEGNELDVYRECLRPGAKASIEISVDDRIDGYFDDLTLDASGLNEILRESFEFYSECFLSHFEQEDSKEERPDGGSLDDGICRHIMTGIFAGRRCQNHAINGTGYCGLHQDEAQANADPQGVGSQNAQERVACYLGGGVDFMSKTVVAALFGNESERLDVISRILYSQFPTKAGPSKHSRLINEVKRAGFRPMKPPYGKTKDDHRHWQDQRLGVSPHTMKYGLVGKEKYPMGKCIVSIREI